VREPNPTGKREKKKEKIKRGQENNGEEQVRKEVWKKNCVTPFKELGVQNTRFWEGGKPRKKKMENP